MPELKSEAAYRACVARVGELMGAEPGTFEGLELEYVSRLAEEYELCFYPIGRPGLVHLFEALQPFVAFARSKGFDALSDTMALTQGSSLAREQIKAGDFKRLLAAFDRVKGEVS